MKYAISPKFSVRDIMGDCVVVPINGCDDGENRLFYVNPTGKIILDCISNGKELDEIVKLFSVQFEMEINDAMNDIAECIDGFAKYGILIQCD